MAKQLEINEESLSIGLEIVQCLTEIKPRTSLSFTLSEEGVSAVNDVLALTEWGIGKNAHKLKKSALAVLNGILEHPKGAPVNVNLTRFDIKAMKKVRKLIKKSLINHKNSVFTKYRLDNSILL